MKEASEWWQRSNATNSFAVAKTTKKLRHELEIQYKFLARSLRRRAGIAGVPRPLSGAPGRNFLLVRWELGRRLHGVWSLEAGVRGLVVSGEQAGMQTQTEARRVAGPRVRFF